MPLDHATTRALRRHVVVHVVGTLAAITVAVIWCATLFSDHSLPVAAPFVVLGSVILPLFVSPDVPIPAARALLRGRDTAQATVLMWEPRSWGPTKQLLLRIGDGTYLWRANLPDDCIPHVGGTLTLRGDVRDRGWVMALDATYGNAYPQARLRRQVENAGHGDR